MEVALVIEIDGVTYRMSVEEARELHANLSELFAVPVSDLPWVRKYPWEDWTTAPCTGPYVDRHTTRLDF